MSARVSVEPNDSDYSLALQRETLSFSWEHLKESATRIAAQRVMGENRANRDALIARASRLTGRELRDAQDELTRLFDENDALMDRAFPETSSAALSEREGGK